MSLIKRNIQRQEDRRREHPSIIIPIGYWIFELIGGWLFLSMFAVSLQINEWNMLSKIIFSIWVIYTGYKFIHVMSRQYKEKKKYEENAIDN